jgi:Zn-dependent M28 family amino/carboxypeptidase
LPKSPAARGQTVFPDGGHLDSWDLGTGAIDDAAGIAITTAAAHLIGQLTERPARSIRVVAFANEESGLYGGKAYAAEHHLQIGKAILGAESDAGADRIVKVTATVKPEARGAINQIAKALAPLGIEYDATAAGSGGSDLSAVHAVGMAGLSLHQDATRYFDWHHTANDTLDKVDPEQLRQNVAAYAVAMFWPLPPKVISVLRRVRSRKTPTGTDCSSAQSPAPHPAGLSMPCGPGAQWCKPVS